GEQMDTLEQHYGDMQDIEFTVERGTLYILQTRAGKRTAAAAVRVAREMVDEGVIDRSTALLRVDPGQLDQLLHPAIDPSAPREVLTRGLNASPGAAVGAVVFDADTAEERGKAEQAVILVRWETTPDDIHGVLQAQGVLTARGGMTSHAAVVARQMGKPCVAGAEHLQIDVEARTFTVDGTVVSEGDQITIDGGTGEVMLGAVATIQPELSGDFAKLMVWADEYRRMKVRANAETPNDARMARRFGAEGIGLCRTEHMFFDGGRIVAMREMIVAETIEGRRAALAKILPMQRDDFVELFRIMKGLPVTVRLLDPPLHEFLPNTRSEMEEVAKAAGVSVDHVAQRAAMLKESNPMLGHRGCRLGITYPEVYEMQARAIFEAAALVKEETGETVEAEIMIPLVAIPREFSILKEMVDRVEAEVTKARGIALSYTVGTMIELPRACLLADKIALDAEFFSFGTNDLTQTTYGLSRDDAARFLQEYERRGILAIDPFISLDPDGVGELVKLAAERGRRTRPDLKLGICGEHGGDPASIRFCAKVGLDYVSCSPFRVPIARLAAAQAALSETGAAAHATD
ncbi:MAG TPA: pyruvate, phosphate dikinase, partial [Dongiaceae bacterium]